MKDELLRKLLELRDAGATAEELASGDLGFLEDLYLTKRVRVLTVGALV